jgi:hypothetical protein
MAERFGFAVGGLNCLGMFGFCGGCWGALREIKDELKEGKEKGKFRIRGHQGGWKGEVCILFL